MLKDATYHVSVMNNIICNREPQTTTVNHERDDEAGQSVW